MMSHRSKRSERLRREMRHEEEEPTIERKYEEEPGRVRRYEEHPRKSPLNALKCKIPPFSHLEWEMKVDQLLQYFNYDDYEKVRMVTYEFN
ncbi:hypothetical protein CR513_16602, partial [Mucuna pruriens]